jgi:hypothetical protein
MYLEKEEEENEEWGCEIEETRESSFSSKLAHIVTYTHPHMACSISLSTTHW